MIDQSALRIQTGPLAREVARFGAPLAIGMGLQVTFNLVDAYLISRLEPELAGPGLGAIGICDQVAALGTIVSYGLSIATAAIVSRKQGSGDQLAMRRVAWQSLIFVLATQDELPARRAFEAIYAAFLGRANGPRAGWLLASLEPAFVMRRLDEAAGAVPAGGAPDGVAS